MSVLLIAALAVWSVGGVAFAVWVWTGHFDLELPDALVASLAVFLGPLVGLIWILAARSAYREPRPPTVLIRRRK